MGIMDNIGEEFRTRNFSIYGQWLGILCIILCWATGISTLITINVWFIIFGALAVAFGCFILFIEVPFLLRICPTSSKFDAAVRTISTNWMRAASYCGMSLVLFLSLIRGTASIIAAAVFLALAGLCYLLAAIKGQSFVGSKTLGGQGVAQMIV